MTFKSPADVAAAIAEERGLYAERANLAMDLRIAERNGDDTAITVARQIKAAGDTSWYEAYKAAQTGLKDALETLGFDPAAIKTYL